MSNGLSDNRDYPCVIGAAGGYRFPITPGFRAPSPPDTLERDGEGKCLGSHSMDATYVGKVNPGCAEVRAGEGK